MVSHHSSTPPWPSQHRRMQVSSPLLNITLSHSRATGDFLDHSWVLCRVFKTNIAQNHKLINNFHKRNFKLWQQICFCTQWDYWKNHEDKWIWEIMKLMTQCVSVLCCWVDWHWLWGIRVGDRPDKVGVWNRLWTPRQPMLLSVHSFGRTCACHWSRWEGICLRWFRPKAPNCWGTRY